ncbi:hypothetical protein FRACYDRAFT_240221 [Fragilariopsis cylindrus CCMP1102]|uniref:Uncharacterized protein n=1 Tax=Fragilariopsis cylindrus CCMP1102 TaxID=635003 RepID=A0A1E7FBI9_9STRA|nr:hypothetical protein FRACYDRAFT_240221 [Fragilariopsis cylindrus CCMP1102]|eukprot:OEU15530.1 hypothetical protein FRACYDRAFT_240221 [Fragilariopsis cylindrus CCMP1102]
MQDLVNSYSFVGPVNLPGFGKVGINGMDAAVGYTIRNVAVPAVIVASLFASVCLPASYSYLAGRKDRIKGHHVSAEVATATDSDNVKSRRTTSSLFAYQDLLLPSSNNTKFRADMTMEKHGMFI